MSVRNILVVVDPTREQQSAYIRGAETCLATGAAMTLFACLDEQSVKAEGDDQAARALIQQLSTDAKEKNIAVNTMLDHQQDWPRAIVRTAEEKQCDMVFKTSFDHGLLDRATRETSDYLLLRECPCPVLLIKEHRDWSHRQVLAAIKPVPGDTQHAVLNKAIIGFTNSLADAYGSKVHYVTAYQGRTHKPEPDELSALCGVPEEQVHIWEGWADEVISKVADQLSADLIVIGTVGRTGIMGRTVGNTAEKLLDHTQSDLLVLNKGI